VAYRQELEKLAPDLEESRLSVRDKSDNKIGNEDREPERGCQECISTTELVHSALEGKLDEHDLSEVTTDLKAALEALDMARRGTDLEEHSLAHHVSAMERTRLLNGALAELQPILATAVGRDLEELGQTLEEVQELVFETRTVIKQQALVESTEHKNKRETAEGDRDEDDPEASDGGKPEADAEEEKQKKGGFFSFLSRGRSKKKKGDKRAKGQNAQGLPISLTGDDDDAGK